jgi:hypothetical protein
MPGKDSPAELVLLALPHNAHTGSLQAEVEAPDSGEQRANAQHPGPMPRSTSSNAGPSSNPHARSSASSPARRSRISRA